MTLIESNDVPDGIVYDDIPTECPECGGDIVLDQDYLHCEHWDWEQEAPMRCPECGDDAPVGDGCAFTCVLCAYEWGHESRRPLPGDRPQRPIEPSITPKYK